MPSSQCYARSRSLGFLGALVLWACAQGDPYADDAGYPDSRSDAQPMAAPDTSAPDAPLCGPAEREYQGHCYHHFSTPVRDWNAAQASCEALSSNAHLATISDAAEDSLLDGIAGGAETWIGLNNGQGSYSTWATGELTGFTDWASGEPNGGGGHCVRIKASRWADAPCGDAFGYICEHP